MSKPNKFIDAAMEVLRHSDRPMLAGEIWAASSELPGYDWNPDRAASPEATQNAELGIYARKDGSAIVRTVLQPYYYWLADREWPEGYVTWAAVPFTKKESSEVLERAGFREGSKDWYVLCTLAGAAADIPISLADFVRITYGSGTWVWSERGDRDLTPEKAVMQHVRWHISHQGRHGKPAFIGLSERGGRTELYWVPSGYAVPSPAKTPRARKGIEGSVPVAGPSPIAISSTFRSVRFNGETDGELGLEDIVTRGFFEVFRHLPKLADAMLLSGNRTFGTTGKDDEGLATGTGGVPDAVLLSYDAGRHALSVSLVEYECHGKRRPRASQQQDYFNQHIVPQLVRFAATFAASTTKTVRDQTATAWAEKVVAAIEGDEGRTATVEGWFSVGRPDLTQKGFFLELHRLLVDALAKRVEVMLVIDELSAEQQETLRSLVGSFRLPGGKTVGFDARQVALLYDDREGRYGLADVTG